MPRTAPEYVEYGKAFRPPPSRAASFACRWLGRARLAGRGGRAVHPFLLGLRPAILICGWLITARVRSRRQLLVPTSRDSEVNDNASPTNPPSQAAHFHDTGNVLGQPH